MNWILRAICAFISKCKTSQCVISFNIQDLTYAVYVFCIFIFFINLNTYYANSEEKIIVFTTWSCKIINKSIHTLCSKYQRW